MPRRVWVPKAPRRVSGPVRVRPARERLAPLPERVAHVIRTLPDHSLLDRIVRGRTWILLLGVMLAGIVAMQVELLKLNTNIGRSLQLGAALQSRNDLLRASVSSLSDAQRIEKLASGMGMVMAGPTAVQFLGGRRVDPAQAAANIHSPDAGTFQSALQAMLTSASAASSPGGSASAPATGTGTAAAQTGTAGTTTGSSAGSAPVGATSGQLGGATNSQGNGAASAGTAGPAAGRLSSPTTSASTPTGATTSTGASTPSGTATPSGGAAAPTGAATSTGVHAHRATPTSAPSG